MYVNYNIILNYILYNIHMLIVIINIACKKLVIMINDCTKITNQKKLTFNLI